MKVEVERNGQTITKTTQAAIMAGQEIAVSMKLDARNDKELVATVAQRSRQRRAITPDGAAGAAKQCFFTLRQDGGTRLPQLFSLIIAPESSSSES